MIVSSPCGGTKGRGNKQNVILLNEHVCKIEVTLEFKENILKVGFFTFNTPV